MEIEQANIERFNEIAAHWDEDPARVRMAEAVAQSMLAALTPQGSEQVLEFGCGTGLITLAVAPHVAHITAMDSSTEMLAVLRHKCEQCSVANLTLRQGTVPDDLPDASYDLVVSSMTLHHVADVGHLFRILFDRLKPGGRVAFADLDTEDGSFHGDAPGVAHHGFERAGFKRLLAGAGFDAVRFSTAYKARKQDERGAAREYSIFLAVARKPADQAGV